MAIRRYAVRDNVLLGDRVHIGLGTTLWAPDQLSVDSDVYIGKRCTIEVNGSIGAGTIIGNNVGLVGRRDHDYRDVGRSMRDALWVGSVDVDSSGPEYAVIVGEDCWLGFGCVVLSGVEIGRGAVIAAGAVVARNVEPYAIVAGNPATPVGQRLSRQQQEAHERLLSGSSRPED